MKNKILAAAALFTVLAGASTAHGATFTVSDWSDNNAHSQHSLRYFINSPTVLDGDVIIIPAGTITLMSGSLKIMKNISIQGAGATSTVIDGSGGITGDRVFDITGNVSISGVTIQNGYIVSGGGGTGGTSDGVHFGPPLIYGGGGGGILVEESGALTLSNSTVSGNYATVGGGIASYGSLTVKDSTISKNAGGFGGGIAVNSDGTFAVTNSTITNNAGIGIFADNISNQATLVNVTISNNTGAGLTSYVTPTILQNSILAFNLDKNCAPLTVNWGPLPATTLTSLGHNLDSDGSCGFAATGDLANIDPLLAPLADNGGPTKTQALQAGSPAIDAGDNGACPDHDQRGAPRPVDGKGDGTVNCDIGAFEFGSTAPGGGTTGGSGDFKMHRLNYERLVWPHPQPNPGPVKIQKLAPPR